MRIYRATVNNIGNDEDYLKSDIEVIYHEYDVIKETKMFYIINIKGKNKRVGKFSKSAFDRKKKEDALIDCYYRNIRHKYLLNIRMQYSVKVREFLKNQIHKQ